MYKVDPGPYSLLASITTALYTKGAAMTLSALGIDVSKATLDVCLITNRGSQSAQFNNCAEGHRKLHKWLKKRAKAQETHVCLEATGQYGDPIASYLYELHYPVSVMNPSRIKSYARSLMRRNKTDKADAQVIADFCLKQEPELWSPPPQHMQDLKAMVRRLNALKDNRQQEKNRLQSGVSTPWVMTDLEEHIAFLEERIDTLSKAIQEHINQFPELKKQRDLLDTIPGIGKLTAATILAEIPHIAEFDSARQVAAYAGLTPRNFLSGSSVHPKTRLSKTGNAHLRRALYMPAVSATRWNPIIHDFYQKRQEHGLCKLAALAACMRKLLHIAFGILKHMRPFDPNYLNTMPMAI